jgi:hypothetical protein
MNFSTFEKGSIAAEKGLQVNDTLKVLLEEIDDHAQWFCNEYASYPTRKKEQKQYRDGLTSIVSEFTDEIVVWAKRAGKLPEKEQILLLDLLASFGNSFRSISLALRPQIRVATIQAILEEIKSYSGKFRAQFASKDVTVLNLTGRTKPGSVGVGRGLFGIKNGGDCGCLSNGNRKVGS